jgi:membrane protease YdiL (CAAX protease family)
MDEPKESLPTQASDTPQPQPTGNIALPVTPRKISLSQRVHTLFVGPEGLRLVWRFVLYLAMAIGIAFLLGALSHIVNLTRNRLWTSMLAEIQLLLAAVVPALIMRRIERRPFGAYGLPPQNAFGKLFWLGALWGLVALTVLMTVLRGAGVFYFGNLALHGVRVLKFAAFWGLFFLLVGLFEEFLMRGYTLFTLMQAFGFWPAAITLSILFGTIHLANQGEAWIGAAAAGLIGFFYCLTLRRTGNLWFAVGFHASWDWGETYLYSVPNSGTVAPGHLLSSSFHGSPWLSGGSVGPEGSVFVFVVIAGLWVIFDRLYPEVKYPG